jgi:transposase InsO family protein
MEKTLKTIYYDSRHAGAYGGLRRLWSAVKGKGYAYTDVKKWLQSQDAYSLHKPARKNFTRSRVLVGGIDQQWQADLVDMQEFAKENEGFRYLLVVIDVFSKYAWVAVLKTKTGAVVRDAFEAILKQGRVPNKLQTDNGTEFYNATVKSLLQRHRIHHFSTLNNETKASVVERLNRTLKTDMWHYFTANNTRKYVNIVQNLVRSYNDRVHRSIKMAPSSVTTDNSQQVAQNLYGKRLTVKPRTSVSVGDTVMITKSKRLFDKGYLPNWTYEQFTVKERLGGQPPRFRIQDYNGDVIMGTFCGPELQPTKKRDTYYIEKILRRRKNEMLVKWWGYPASFNQWIPAADVHKIKHNTKSK